MNFWKGDVKKPSSSAPKKSEKPDFAMLRYLNEEQQERYRAHLFKSHTADNRPASPHPEEIPIDKKYLPQGKDAPPVYEYKDTDVAAFIDGAEYFPALYDLINRTGKGDTMCLTARFSDFKINLLGYKNPDHELGKMLAKKAAEGVKVRIIIAGAGPFRTSIRMPFLDLFYFRKNYRQADILRHMTENGDVESVRYSRTIRRMLSKIGQNRAPMRGNPPLRGSVLVTAPGGLTSSYHVKCAAFHFSSSNEFAATVGGIDPMPSRFDDSSHTRKKDPEGNPSWHDVAAGVMKGGAAEYLLRDLEKYWKEDTRRRQHGRVLKRTTMGWPTFGRLNPPLEEFGEALKQSDTTNPPPNNASEIVPSEDTSSASDSNVKVQILRSMNPVKRPRSLSRPRGERWSYFPEEGVQEIFYCVTPAIQSAKEYIYIEDQYLCEQTGGNKNYEIYPFLVDAVKRGVKIILVGSGERDALDKWLFRRGINRTVNSDIQKKVLDQLTPEERNNVVVLRLENTKVHAKVVAVDDEFIMIGSANIMSRSMSGQDQETSMALVTKGSWVRKAVRRLMGEHWRLSPEYSEKFKDLNVDAVLGFFRPQWATTETPDWPRGKVLTFVGPEWTESGGGQLEAGRDRAGLSWKGLNRIGLSWKGLKGLR